MNQFSSNLRRELIVYRRAWGASSPWNSIITHKKTALRRAVWLAQDKRRLDGALLSKPFRRRAVDDALMTGPRDQGTKGPAKYTILELSDNQALFRLL